MLISFVVPAYNVSASVGRTLDSVYAAKLPDDWAVEVLVVDDGSSDGLELATVVSYYPNVRLLIHEKNRGMCAARNTGITASSGEVVSILDADDELVLGWASTLKAVLVDWPTEVNVCYAACCNPEGMVTAQVPDYNGLLTLSDILNERNSGEYLPLFRGNYVRGKSYIDLGTRKSCGIVSYINFALDGPFWVSNRILRIYHEAYTGSVSSGWTTAKKARETALCYQQLFERYEDLYQREAPLVWRTKSLRLAVYLRFAGITGAWTQWCKGASLACLKETLGALLILLVGATIGGRVAQLIKQMGLIRRYG